MQNALEVRGNVLQHRALVRANLAELQAAAGRTNAGSFMKKSFLAADGPAAARAPSHSFATLSLNPASRNLDLP
jgi:hypothetical protein